MNEIFQRFSAIAPGHRQSQTVVMWVELNNVLEYFPFLLIGGTMATAVVTGFSSTSSPIHLNMVFRLSV